MYQTIGYAVRPEGLYIPQYARDFVTRSSWVQELRDFALSMGENRGQTRLRNLLVGNVIAGSITSMPQGSPARRALIHLMVKLLAHAGYLTDAVPIIEKRTCPILTIDQLAERIVARSYQYPTAADYGGDFATISNFIAVAQVALAELSYAADSAETLRTVARLRTYVGHIGWKIRRSMALTQAERTFFMLYRSTEDGTPGHSQLVSNTNIPAAETADPLVLAAFQAAGEVGIPGPFWRNYKLLSEGPVDQRIVARGIMPPKITTRIGHTLRINEFSHPYYETLDEAPWGFTEALASVYDRTNYVQQPDKAAVGLQGVQPIQTLNFGTADYLQFAFIADDPSIKLRLDQDANVAQIIWGYNDPYKEREVNTTTAHLDINDYLEVVARSKSTYGANEFAALEADGFGFADYGDVAEDFEELTEDTLIEEILLPRPNSNSFYMKRMNMAVFYLRRGVGLTRSLLSNLAVAPRSYYYERDENMMMHIAGQEGLTRDQVIRFGQWIAMSHQVAKWRRMTGNEPQFDWKAIVTASTGKQIDS